METNGCLEPLEKYIPKAKTVQRALKKKIWLGLAKDLGLGWNNMIRGASSSGLQ